MKTPYEEGQADSYYQRGMTLARPDWTETQLAEYKAGFEANEEAGDFKEWRPGYSIEGDDYDEVYD